MIGERVVMLSAGAATVAFLLQLQWNICTGEVMELGQVKCTLLLPYSKPFREAHESCWRKKEEELKAMNEEEAKGTRPPYPFNATIEEFEWDDKCMDHCVYKTAGLLGADEALPEKMDVEKLFGRGKVTDDHYKVFTSAWSECLELSVKIGKKKAFDKCKTVTHHEHCFRTKENEIMENTEIEC